MVSKFFIFDYETVSGRERFRKVGSQETEVGRSKKLQ